MDRKSAEIARAKIAAKPSKEKALDDLYGFMRERESKNSSKEPNGEGW